jgi:hypothetical protein
VSDKEKREAEALARALEGDGSPEGIPDDALQAAGLLRASREDAGLDPARQQEILEKILPEKKPRRIPWLRWLVPVAGVAGVLFLVMMVPIYSKAPQQAAAPFPAPPRSLLMVQARAATRHEDIKALEKKMRAYRGRMYASLSGKYPE